MNFIYSWLREMLNLDVEKVKAWGPVLIGLSGIFVGLAMNLVVVFVQWFNNKRQASRDERQLALLRSKEERDDILKRLNQFYGPFRVLRAKSRTLFGKFVVDLDERSKAASRRFKTLDHLLEGGTLTPQEESILKEILSDNQKLLELIQEQSGLVDKPALQELLGKLCAHINILQMAYEKKLSGPERFRDIVFPLAVDGAVESATVRLQDRLKEMNELAAHAESAPDGKKRALFWKTGNATLKYYDDNADAYERQTLRMDLAPLYARFIAAGIPRGGRILDAGCGVGRDTRHFIEDGFVAISFDGSAAMVQKCRQYPHAYCLQLDFKDVIFKEEFDGVWCCASLLHLKLEEARSATANLISALKSSGVLFLSLKVGAEDASEPDGRYFQYYDEESAKSLYADDPRVTLIESWRSEAPETNGKKRDEWLNLILRRIPRQDRATASKPAANNDRNAPKSVEHGS